MAQILQARVCPLLLGRLWLLGGDCLTCSLANVGWNCHWVSRRCQKRVSEPCRSSRAQSGGQTLFGFQCKWRMNQDRTLTLPSGHMGRAWAGWCFAASLPFIRYGHWEDGLTWSIAEAWPLLSLHSTLETPSLWINCPTEQKCWVRCSNRAVLLANGMGRDCQGWTGKCFALFSWRTGWWCRRLDPSVEWIENGLKGHV